jgi:hypothetical protein
MARICLIGVFVLSCSIWIIAQASLQQTKANLGQRQPRTDSQPVVLGLTIAHGDANNVGCRFELTKRAYVTMRPTSHEPKIKEIGHSLLGNDDRAYTQLTGWTHDLRAIILVGALNVPSCTGHEADYPFSVSSYIGSIYEDKCAPFDAWRGSVFQVAGNPRDFFGFADGHLYEIPNAARPIQLYGAFSHAADVNPTSPTVYDAENVSCTGLPQLPCDISCRGKEKTCLFVRDGQSKKWFSTCGPSKHVYGRWAPDGRKLVYAWNSDEDPYQLGLVQFDLSDFRKDACSLKQSHCLRRRML